jgi:hypothetical protein
MILREHINVEPNLGFALTMKIDFVCVVQIDKQNFLCEYVSKGTVA